MLRLPPSSTLFPYTTSSDLGGAVGHHQVSVLQRLAHHDASVVRRQDRKSTRLNSSHGYISYAVFCLKKKINAYMLSFMLRCTLLDNLAFLLTFSSLLPSFLI